MGDQACDYFVLCSSYSGIINPAGAVEPAAPSYYGRPMGAKSASAKIAKRTCGFVRSAPSYNRYGAYENSIPFLHCDLTVAHLTSPSLMYRNLRHYVSKKERSRSQRNRPRSLASGLPQCISHHPFPPVPWIWSPVQGGFPYSMESMD
jgi:hypothetical protein